MNGHLTSMLNRLKESMNIEDEDELGEASNNTDAYAGGEGPQKTPFAFSSNSQKQQQRKFASDSASYNTPVEKTNRFFVKMESFYKRIEDQVQRIDEISYDEYRVEAQEGPKQKINQTIKEVDSKLREIEKMLVHSFKYKNEIQANDSIFYKDTIRKFNKIQERLLKLGTKIREFGT